MLWIFKPQSKWIYSPYELVFGHKMTLSHELEIKVDTVVSGPFKDFYEKLKKNLQNMGERLQKFRSQRLDLLNKDREYQAFEVGQIVCVFQARGSVIKTGSSVTVTMNASSVTVY